MEKLSVPLSAITESGVIVDVTLPAAQLQPQGAPPVPVRNVSVRGTLRHVGDEYLFTGSVTGAYEAQCDRCLENVTAPFDNPVIWSFRAGGIPEEPFAELTSEDIPADDLATVGLEGSEVHLGPQVWEELVLSAPLKYLCREDCAGLCPRCGENLNLGPCKCPSQIEEKTMDNTGLRALGDMFPDLKPKDPEE